MLASVSIVSDVSNFATKGRPSVPLSMIFWKSSKMEPNDVRLSIVLSIVLFGSILDSQISQLQSASIQKIQSSRSFFSFQEL